MIIFERLQLYNWGPYRANEFALDAPIVDFVGENGSGKTHILDAIVTALNLPETIYEGREVGSFQRDPTKPAFVLLTIRNPLMSSGRRAFVEYGSKLTIVTRVRANIGDGRQYALLDGNVDMKTALDMAEEQRIKWFRIFKDYEDKWQRAGYPHLDRAIRMLHHERPKEVRRSNPRTLYNLFERLTNNAESVQKLVEARSTYDECKVLFQDATRRQSALDTEFVRANATLDRMNELARKHETLVEEERLLKAAEYKAALSALEAAKRGLGDVEAKRAELTKERQELLNEQPKVLRNLGLAKTASEQFELQRAEAAKKRQNLTISYGQAQTRAQRAQEENEELLGFRDLPPTGSLKTDLGKVETLIVEVSERQGGYNERIRHLDELLHYAKKGLPPEVLAGVKALEARDIAFQKAWEVLPNDHGRNFEEALGDARYGVLLKDASHLDEAVSALAEHNFPGPVSTISQQEYVRRATEWTAHDEGYATPLGVHVLQGKPPVLNAKLVEEHRRSLSKQRTKLKTEADALDGQIAQFKHEAESLKASLETAPRRDQLESNKRERAEAIAAFEDMERSYPGQIEHLDDIERTANKASLKCDELQKRANQIATRLDEIAVVISQPSSTNFIELEQTIAATWRVCESYYADVKEKVLTVKYHADATESLKKSIGLDHVPTVTELEAQNEEVKRVKQDAEAQQSIVAGTEERLRKAEANHKGLEDKLRSNIISAHERVERDVKALAEKVGFGAELKLRFADNKWHLDYKVAFQTDESGERIFRPINNKADSTGEGAIAALALCLAMSDPTTAAWYLLDEPAQNFSPKNVVNMFRVFGPDERADYHDERAFRRLLARDGRLATHAS